MPISADALVKAGMPDITAREIVMQMTTATPNVPRLISLGIPQPTAVELGAQIGSGNTDVSPELYLSRLDLLFDVGEVMT